MRKLTLLIAVLASTLSASIAYATVSATARAADTVYFGDLFDNTFKVGPLDGSGLGDLTTTGATLAGPFGTAIDAAAGRVYWANLDAHAISFAALDGSGGGDVAVKGAPVDFPVGLALDPLAGRLYWFSGNDTLATAKLDGTDGRTLTIDHATVDGPLAVAVDPAGGRIYWTNNDSVDGDEPDTISTAKLDGSDDHDIAIDHATVDDPFGIAVDPAGGRIYWVNNGGLGGGTISTAKLDGSDDHDIAIDHATVAGPLGIAVDPAAGKLYWADSASPDGLIGVAKLDGTDDHDLVMGEDVSAGFPALLQAPQPAGAPAVAGGTGAGSTLSCSRGTWAPDFAASFVYKAPQSFAYQWTRDGADLSGATQSTLKAGTGGDYRCRVTARNHAGSAVQTSAPHHVAAATPPPPATFGAQTRVTLALASARVPARGPLAVRVANGNGFAVGGTLSAQTAKPVAAAHKRRVSLAARRLSLGAHGARTLKLTLPASLQRLLRHRGKLAFVLSATVTDPAGHRRTVKATVTLKLRGARS